MTKYTPLTDALQTAGRHGQKTVELSFVEVAELVGSLPNSARSLRQWWANSSQVQAQAWRDAGFHVEWVSLDHERVRFAMGVVGGSHHARQTSLTSSSLPTQASRSDAGTLVHPSSGAAGELRDASVDVHLTLLWQHAGLVSLDHAGKPAFEPLPLSPGLYRLTFRGTAGHARQRIYVGETDSLRRRLMSNYRNPGSSQPTNLPINARLREHLASGGVVEVAVATVVTARVSGSQPVELDLSVKASRLLAENAALLQIKLGGDSDIENL